MLKLSAGARAELRLPAGDDPVLLLELRPAGPSGAGLMLILAGEAADDDDTRYALRTLAHQVALALSSAELSAEVHRRASEARFATLVQNSSDLITVIDAGNTVLYQSPSIERVLGYTVEEVTGRPFEQLLHPDEQGRLLRRLTDGAGATGRAEVIDCLLAHKDGSLRHFEILHADLLGDSAVGGIVLNGRDVSERKAFEEQLAHQAFHDPVTHLANRALFNERVRHAVARTLRDGVGMAVLFVDLDDFKTVNDSLGHAVGDRVLLEVAQRVSASVRAADTAARFGGDEFAILLEDVDDPQTAVETAERILDSLARPLELDDNSLVIRASLGISVVEPGNATDADELIRNADAAMYIAKAEGKGGYRLFEPAMHDRVVARLALRADLQRALEREEFELHYQPLVRLEDEAVTGVEALVRWRHPVRGLIPPFEFIPFAEESGLIVDIGRWVLREGCRQAKVLRERLTGSTAPSIGINLSVKQLFHSDIVSRRRRCAGRGRARTRGADARDHRVGDDDRHRAGDQPAQRAACARRAPGDGRLRHRLLVAELVEPAPARHPQDGPLAAGCRRVAGDLRARLRGAQPRRDVRARGRGRGHRVPRAVGHAPGARMRHRAGLLLRQADGARAPDQLPG